jgi:hypothetical protein
MDKNLRQILNEIKLEFTTDSDYLLQYYTYKDFIRKEQEEGVKAVTKNNDISIKKTRVIINTPDNTETAELELNINKDVTIMVYLDTRSGQDKYALLIALANFVKSGKLEEIINSNQNAKIVRIYIQKETEVTYALYADDTLVLEKNTIRVVSPLQAVLATVVSILRYSIQAILIISSLALSGLLFIVTLYVSLSSDFARKLVAKLVSKFNKLNKALKADKQIILLQAKNNIQKFNEHIAKKDLEEYRKKFPDVTDEEFEKMKDNKLKNVSNIPKKESIIAVYTIFALAISIIIFQILGMPLLGQIAIILLYMVFMIAVSKFQDDPYSTAVYVITNFEETFKMVVKDTSIDAILLKGLLAGSILFAITYAIKIKNQKPSSNFPSPDRLLTEIQTRFK